MTGGPSRSASREVGKVGMQIAGNRHRLDLEDRQQVPEGFLEERDCLRRVEIADMLRDKGFATAGDRYRRLELGTQGDDAAGPRAPARSAPA